MADDDPEGSPPTLQLVKDLEQDLAAILAENEAQMAALRKESLAQFKAMQDAVFQALDQAIKGDWPGSDNVTASLDPDNPFWPASAPKKPSPPKTGED